MEMIKEEREKGTHTKAVKEGREGKKGGKRRRTKKRKHKRKTDPSADKYKQQLRMT